MAPATTKPTSATQKPKPSRMASYQSKLFTPCWRSFESASPSESILPRLNKVSWKSQRQQRVRRQEHRCAWTHVHVGVVYWWRYILSCRNHDTLCWTRLFPCVRTVSLVRVQEVHCSWGIKSHSFTSTEFDRSGAIAVIDLEKHSPRAFLSPDQL